MIFRKTSSYILFETNVLVYNQDKDSKFYKEASSYHNKVLSGKIKAAISSQNLLEFSAVIINSKKIVSPLTQQQAALETAKYIESNLFKLIYLNKKTLSIYNFLLNKYKLKNSRLVFDLFLVATMLANNITKILTENTKDFRYEEVVSIRL